MKPSPNDLKKLRKIANIINSGKKMTKNQYTSLCKCKTLPKYIMNHIHYYYNISQNYKQYGGECIQIWSIEGSVNACNLYSDK